MWFTDTYAKGMSVLEVLISIAIVTLLATLSFSALTQFLNTNAVEKETAVVVATLAYARSQSMSGTYDTSYGVHFASSTITVFWGSTYSQSASTNVSRQFGGGVVVSALSLGSGVVDIVFSKLTGAPSATGTITISSPKDPINKKVLTITGTGLVQ